MGRITKGGDGETRTALFEAANVVLAINPMVSDKGLSGACCPPARKQACEGRAGQKDGCRPSECGLMEPNSDGRQWRKDAIAIPRDARRGAWRQVEFV